MAKSIPVTGDFREIATDEMFSHFETACSKIAIEYVGTPVSDISVLTLIHDLTKCAIFWNQPHRPVFVGHNMFMIDQATGQGFKTP